MLCLQTFLYDTQRMSSLTPLREACAIPPHLVQNCSDGNLADTRPYEQINIGVMQLGESCLLTFNAKGYNRVWSHKLEVIS